MICMASTAVEEEEEEVEVQVPKKGKRSKHAQQKESDTPQGDDLTAGLAASRKQAAQALMAERMAAFKKDKAQPTAAASPFATHDDDSDDDDE